MPDPLSDVLRVAWDNRRAPKRVLVTTVNQSTNTAQVVILHDSIPVPGASITLTIEEMHAHIIGCIRTYDMMRNPSGDRKLVMPFMMGGKALLP